jgi:hypothetical protein
VEVRSGVQRRAAHRQRDLFHHHPKALALACRPRPWLEAPGFNFRMGRHSYPNFIAHLTDTALSLCG